MPRLGRTSALALIWLLALPPLWLSLVAAPSVRVEVGRWGDHAVLSGVNAPEEAAQEDYRWTTARAELALPNLSGRYELLAMRAHGWRPEGTPSPTVRLEAGGRPFGEFATAPALRVYRVLLPADGSRAETRVAFASDAYAPPGDSREIGFAIDWLALDALGCGDGPAPLQLGGQALLLALALILLGSLGLGLPVTLLAALALCAALVGANLYEPLWVGLGLPAWLALAAGLLAAARLLWPLAARLLAGWMSPSQARWAFALVMAAFALRLAGAAHPLFDSRDMPVHTRWLETVAGGELYLYSTPGELQNRKTFNPPAGYLLLLPLRLALPDDRLAVQVGTALLDALGCLLLLPLARELRLGPRAALLGLALALALPINMTMMWWGFAANAIAQSLWLLLLWLLLRLTRAPTRRDLVLTTVAGALCLTTHVGALVLVVAMLGLVVALGWRLLPRDGWGAMLLAAALALLITVPLYFSAAAAPLGGAERSPAALDLAASLARGLARRDERLGLVWRAVVLGWLPPLIALAPVGLAMLWTARERHPLSRLLVGGSLLVCAVFLTVYVLLGLLTRYIYFVTPLVCLAAALPLAWLWERRGGRWLSAAVVLFVIWSGTTLWLAGVLMRVRPSLVPLTQ